MGVWVKKADINHKDELKQYHCLDGPARIWTGERWGKTNHNGRKEWWVNGRRHRTDGPAIIYPNGRQDWYIDGRKGRVDGPAVIRTNGSEEWWLNSVLHREGGLPAIIRSNGTKQWYYNGLLHRTDGPAVIMADGRKEWWVNGLTHRLDGPAKIWPNYVEDWWVTGEQMGSDEVKLLNRKVIINKVLNHGIKESSTDSIIE